MKKVWLYLCGIALAFTFFSGCDSSPGQPYFDVTPPAVPQGLTIDRIGNGAVQLSWTAVRDEDLRGYSVYWRGGAQIDTLNANKLFTTSNAASISGLDYNTIYFFAVTSLDQSGNESAFSSQQRGIPSNITSPSPPSEVDLVGENIDYPKITVFWTANTEPDLAYYRVYRALTPGGLADSTSYIAPVTKENYADIKVEIGVVYFYRITAVDKGGWESVPSSVISDYVLSKALLISPVNFGYVGAVPTFTWTSVPGAKKYNVVVTTSRIGGEILNVEVDNSITRFVYNGKTRLISGNTYYWRVGAISRSEINSVSDIGSFVVQGQ
ncbi:MAG: fibronectin type III domain-containing protein [Candidatus Latescibacter sp.]|nr:fibronectin type III domain-containing protein [Candidatus Latescibacter sp.]